MGNYWKLWSYPNRQGSNRIFAQIHRYVLLNLCSCPYIGYSCLFIRRRRVCVCVCVVCVCEGGGVACVWVWLVCYWCFHTSLYEVGVGRNKGGITGIFMSVLFRTVCCEPLNLLQPHLAWWCIIVTYEKTGLLFSRPRSQWGLISL